VRAIALGEQVAARLRVAIITGEIPSGRHLAEDSLAAQFDVSRGPVRDALRVLLKEGLVEQRRTRLFARGLTFKDIDELYGLRELIEVAAAREAVANAGTSDWAAGRAIIEEMRAAAASDDNARFTAADSAFHQLAFDLSENRRLNEVWRQFEGTFTVLFDLSNTPDMHAAARDHEHILELYSAGDADEVAREVRNHLQRARAHIRDVVRAVATRVETDSGSVGVSAS
jgi:GntR family transcriptional regulator of gluconate operon